MEENSKEEKKEESEDAKQEENQEDSKEPKQDEEEQNEWAISTFNYKIEVTLLVQWYLFLTLF